MSIMDAIKSQDIKKIERALKVRSALGEVDAQGNTVLHAAILTGNPEIVSLILDLSPAWKENLAKQTPYDLARSLLGRKNHVDREAIARRVGRYFDAAFNPVLSPITTPADGCSRQYLRQTTEIKQEHGGARLHAALVHHSRKTQIEKSRFVLSAVHAELRQALARMEQPQVGNIAAAAITFELKILRNDKRLFYTIPIKVSGKPVFTISDTLNLGEDDLQSVLDDLKAMHTAGKQAHGGHKHFQTPKYDNTAGDAQLINHSEQPLYYYLKTEVGASTIVNRLIAELRGKDLIAFGEEIKVSNIAVHLHSTKTPCGPCETVIAGAQCLGDITQALKDAFIRRSYIKTNTNANISTSSESYHFSFPKKALRLVTSYSADTKDTHAAPSNQTLGWRYNRLMSEIEINSSIQASYRNVYVVKFVDKPPIDDGREVSDYTIFSSASDSNKNVAKRKNEYKEVNDDSLSDLSESLSYMQSVEREDLKKGPTGAPWSAQYKANSHQKKSAGSSSAQSHQPKI